jgi:hypothetical protein
MRIGPPPYFLPKCTKALIAYLDFFEIMMANIHFDYKKEGVFTKTITIALSILI